MLFTKRRQKKWCYLVFGCQECTVCQGLRMKYWVVSSYVYGLTIVCVESEQIIAHMIFQVSCHNVVEAFTPLGYNTI